MFSEYYGETSALDSAKSIMDNYWNEEVQSYIVFKDNFDPVEVMQVFCPMFMDPELEFAFFVHPMMPYPMPGAEEYFDVVQISVGIVEDPEIQYITFYDIEVLYEKGFDYSWEE